MTLGTIHAPAMMVPHDSHHPASLEWEWEREWVRRECEL
jgi:hypothetical protein